MVGATVRSVRLKCRLEEDGGGRVFGVVGWVKEDKLLYIQDFDGGLWGGASKPPVLIFTY